MIDGVVGSPGVMMGDPVMGTPVMVGQTQQQQERAREDRTPTPFQIAPSISEPLYHTSYAVTRVDVRETSTTSVDLRTAIFRDLIHAKLGGEYSLGTGHVHFRDDRTPTPFQIAPSISEPLYHTSYAVTRVDVRETSTTSVDLRTAILRDLIHAKLGGEYSLGTGHVHFRDDRTPTPFQIAPSISEPLYPTSYAVTRVDVRETSTTSVDLRAAILRDLIHAKLGGEYSLGTGHVNFGKKSKIQFKPGETNVKCVELLSSVVIGGATGTNAAKVNGIYEPTVEVHNGKLLFQKRGMKDHWLHFDASTGFWIVSTTAGKDAKNNLRWWPLSYSTDRDLQDPKSAVAWRILNGSAWEDQGGVKCVELLLSVHDFDVCETSTTSVDLRTAILRALLIHARFGGGEFSNYKNTSLRTVNVVLPDSCKSSRFEDQGNVKCIELLSSVVIGGATGTNAAKVNGIYEPTVEVYNGKLLFQKRGMKDHWLNFDASTGFWIVSTTAGKDSKNGLRCWCHSTDRDLQDPKRAVAWKILNGQKVEDIERSTWEEQEVQRRLEEQLVLEHKLQQEEAFPAGAFLAPAGTFPEAAAAAALAAVTRAEAAKKEAQERKMQEEEHKRQLEVQRHNFSAENAEEANAKAEAEAKAAAEKAAAEKAAADAKVIILASI